jgi:hypothetical protein
MRFTATAPALQQAEKEYLARKKNFMSFNYRSAHMEKQHEELFSFLENEYQLNKNFLWGMLIPNLFKTVNYNTCKEYADAMTTKDKQKMYSVWKSLFELKGEAVSKAKNAKWNDPRKDDYALIDLINAFNNCANHSFRPKVDEEDSIQNF